MDNVQVAEPIQQAAPVAEPVVQQQAPVVDSSPFALDESRLAGFSPEQRAGLEPIFSDWRKRAEEEISKRETDATTKYKPFEEKAATLDKLTKYPAFVQWWQTQQQQAMQQNPGQQTAIQQTKPQDFATSSEWQDALYSASQGDGTKLQTINARAMAAWATPFVQQMTEKQKQLETQFEMKELMERHPDAKELDQIGIDPKTKEGVSLLEQGFDWAERNGKKLEEGYAIAARWRDQLRVGAQQQAMGIVTSKKNDVTAGPSSSSAMAPSVIEVANHDELLKRSMEAELSGQKNLKFVVKR